MSANVTSDGPKPANPAPGGHSPEAKGADNVQEGTGQEPVPTDSDHPKEGVENEKVGDPHRASTGVRNKLKDQKQKLKDKAKPPGGFDETPIPDAPPGYTVKLTFHRATNLPVADYTTASSDPYLTATLSTALPKRHKEDPDLFFRTRTIWKNLEPVWDEEWIVANVPSSGFKLKCRLYDEDWPDKDDRLGNVTIIVNGINEKWEGFPPPGREFDVKKRVGSKRAYLLKATTSALIKSKTMTPKLYVSAVVLGMSEPPHGHIHTLGPTYYFKHFSPMIGRLAGIKVNKDETAHESQGGHDDKDGESKSQKYDFQANQIQLAGPVPPHLYCRYVEFRPVIGLMFSSKGISGNILNKALHKQHRRIYNFNSSTQYGTFEPCSEEASLQFLKMAHFDEGGRIFTYVITLDGLFRFTETGKEFGIDLLSKHTMHSDVANYIACSGEFFIRRLQKPTAEEDPEPDQPTHPTGEVAGGPPNAPPPTRPQYYQLIIDNDSGTYRPDKSCLPHLQSFLEHNFPGLGIVTLACDDPENEKLKKEQVETKKKEGKNIEMVMNRSPDSSSVSSSDLSDLEDMGNQEGHKGKKEQAFDILENPKRIKDLVHRHADKQPGDEAQETAA